MAAVLSADVGVLESMNASVAAAHPIRDGVLAAVRTDPITDLVARVLTVPLREFYALLWRAGMVEIVR